MGMSGWAELSHAGSLDQLTHDGLSPQIGIGRFQGRQIISFGRGMALEAIRGGPARTHG